MADVLGIFLGIFKILFCYLEALYKLFVQPARKSVEGKVCIFFRFISVSLNKVIC